MQKIVKISIISFFIMINSLALCPAEGGILGIDKSSLKADQPIEVNGDKVEYMTELSKVVAEGNVEINYGTTVLTCDKITVFTNTKEGIAEGNVKLTDKESGTMEGKSLVYNFSTKEGKITDANIKIDPYYCQAKEVNKEATKYVLYNADITTCNLDAPHYHMHCKSVEIIPQDMIIARGVKFFVGTVPILYLPYLSQSIKDQRDGFSFDPGISKEWGTYLLTRYTFWATENLRSTMHFDWRQNKGFAGGEDFELIDSEIGNVTLRYYQINEHLRGNGVVEPIFKDRTRYKVEYSHKWDISDRDYFVMQVNSYSDVNFLKDYFYRQFEKDPTPRSYMLYSHSYPNATLSALVDKRINHFYSATEKTPEIKLDTTNHRIADSNFYFQDNSSITNFTNRTAYTNQVANTVRADTFNKLSHPMNISFINFNPYVGARNTFYTKDKFGDQNNLYRTVFYSGFDMSTKFYKMLSDVCINSWGLEIDKLRHIITPSLSYSYIHDPTLPSDRLTPFDSIDSITKQNRLTLSLENKLQTKRGSDSVNFLTFIVSSPYDFKLDGLGEKSRSRFGDVTFDLEMIPNSRLNYESQAIFDTRKRSFRTANFDLDYKLNTKVSVGGGYRYSRDDSKLLNLRFNFIMSPKWKLGGVANYDVMLKEYQETEFTLTRDLHCWDVQYTVNAKKYHGLTFYIRFVLKAFPDIGFEFDKSTNQPTQKQ